MKLSTLRKSRFLVVLAGLLTILWFGACSSSGGDDGNVDNTTGTNDPGNTNTGSTDPSNLTNNGTDPGTGVITPDPGTGGVVVVDPNTTPDPGTTVVVEDKLRCMDIFGCINDCPGDSPSQECMQTCQDAAEPNSSTLFQAVLSCMQTACSQAVTNDDFQACLMENCGSPVTACEEDRTWPANGLSCVDFYGCLFDCPEGDDSCQTACVNNVSQAGWAGYNSVANCVQAKCTDDQSNDCVTNNCGTELSTCGFSDSDLTTPTGTGTGTCADILTCLQTCADPNDQTCATNCIQTGDQDAVDAFYAVVTCGQSNCSDQTDDAGFSNCLAEKCGTQLNACTPANPGGTTPGDGTSPGGLVDFRNFQSLNKIQSVERMTLTRKFSPRLSTFKSLLKK